MSVKFGVNVMQVSPERLAGAACAADDLGFDCLWVPDHLVFAPVVESRYPYSADGSSPVGPATPFMDPLTTLAYAAAVTKRVRLGTAIYILPIRNPVVTAKVAATLDVLSGGRLILGLGVGWMEEEFRIAGEEFATRGARTDECVAVMKALWTAEEATFKGRFYEFEAARLEPKPVQKPHLPLVFGGETDIALRRAATSGDGWIGMRHTAETVTPQVKKLRRFREEAGRSAEPFEITVLGGPTIDPVTARELGDAGVDRINVYPWQKGSSAAEDLKRFAEDVIARV